MKPEQMNVLLVSDMGKVGGTEIATLIAARELQPHVHFVGVFGKMGPISQKVSDLGVEKFDAVVHTKNPLKVMQYLNQLVSVINKYEINVIHAQMARPVPLLWAAKKLSKQKDLKIFWTSRGLDHETYPRVCPMFDKMGVIGVGNCKQEQQKLIRNGYNPAHTSYVYNAYRLDPKTAVKVKPKRDVINIGTLSALREGRRVDLFLEIAKYIVDKTDYASKVNFLIGGDGPHRETLEQMVRDFDLVDKITFCGNINDVEVFMQGIDIFVSPAVVEGDSGAGLSNAIVEAMITKTPVCAYDAAAICEIVINDFSGHLVKPKDTIAMVNAIINTIENPKASAKYVENAFDLILKECDPKSYVNKLLKIYEEM